MQDTSAVRQNTIVYAQQFTPPLSTVFFVQLPVAEKSERAQWDGKSNIDLSLNRKMAVFGIFTEGKVFIFEYGVRAT